MDNNIDINLVCQQDERSYLDLLHYHLLSLSIRVDRIADELEKFQNYELIAKVRKIEGYLQK